MSAATYVPTEWTRYGGAYAVGWKDAEFGLPLGTGGATYTGTKKLAYEAGFRDFWVKNPQAGGGA